MKRKNVTSKILRDMKVAGIIMSDKETEARFFLNALWVAAYEEGLLEETPWMHRMIQQISPEGVVVNVFENIKQASTLTAYKPSEITYSLEHGTQTSHKWHWKYLIEFQKSPRRDRSHPTDWGTPYSGVVHQLIQKEEINQEAENA